MNIQEFDFSINLSSVLPWQYDNAPYLTALIAQKQAWVDQYYTAFWNNWYTDVFNLFTANEFGLVVWAIILDLPLYLGPDIEVGPIWGFGPKTNGNQNFMHGNFNATNPFQGLTVEEKRFLLLLRYFSLTCRDAIPEINNFLQVVVPTFHSGSGTIYCVDNLDMTMSYVFTFIPDRRLKNILSKYDILPRPAGVRVIIVTPE